MIVQCVCVRVYTLVCVSVQTVVHSPTCESSKLFSGQATKTNISTSIKLAILAGLIFPMAIV